MSSKYVQREPSCSMWTERRIEGRTDMTKLKVAFRNFVNAPKKPFRHAAILLASEWLEVTKC